MNHMFRLVATTFALALTIGVGAAGQDQHLTLQRAIDLIETSGDAERAMPLLEEASQGPDAEVAARALLYMAREQEQRNPALALLTYGRLTTEFAAVAEVASTAARRVDAIQATQQPAMLCELCGDLSGSISADGRLMVVTDPLTSDIGIVDLATQQLVPLRIPGSRQSPGGQTGAPLFPVLSPDGSQVAYSWARGQERAELRVVPRQTGATAKTVMSFQPTTDPLTYPVGWRSDRELVAISASPTLGTEIRVIAVADGSTRPIVSLGQRRIPQGARDVSVSADGRFVVYRALTTNPTGPVTPQMARSMDQQIYIVPVSGGSEVAITSGAGQKRSPLWMPDGRHVLYLSDVSGAWDLWALAIDNGRAAGPPALVRKGVGDVVSMAVANSGRYLYYEGRDGVFRASVATLTPGRDSGATVVNRVIGGLATWSPDGSRLALTRSRPDGQGVDLVIHTLQGGTERVHEHAGLANRVPVWFPDGRSLLVVAGVGAAPAFFRVDADSGTFEQLTARRDDRVMNDPRVKALAPDGRTLYQAAFRDTSARILDRIVALDLQTGAYRDVYRFAGPDGSLPNNPMNLAIALSPDGQTLALNWRDRAAATNGTNAVHLATIGVDGSGFREITTPFHAVNLFNKLAWSRDGQWIYFATRVGNDEDELSRIMRIRPSGGTPEAVGVEAAGLASFDPAPDGRRIVFYTTRPEGAGNLIWSLDVGTILAGGR